MPEETEAARQREALLKQFPNLNPGGDRNKRDRPKEDGERSP